MTKLRSVTSSSAGHSTRAVPTLRTSRITVEDDRQGSKIARFVDYRLPYRNRGNVSDGPPQEALSLASRLPVEYEYAFDLTPVLHDEAPGTTAISRFPHDSTAPLRPPSADTGIAACRVQIRSAPRAIVCSPDGASSWRADDRSGDDLIHDLGEAIGMRPAGDRTFEVVDVTRMPSGDDFFSKVGNTLSDCDSSVNCLRLRSDGDADFLCDLLRPGPLSAAPAEHITVDAWCLEPNYVDPVPSAVHPMTRSLGFVIDSSVSQCNPKTLARYFNTYNTRLTYHVGYPEEIQARGSDTSLQSADGFNANLSAALSRIRGQRNDNSEAVR